MNGVESRVSSIERRLEETLQQQPAYQGNGGMSGSPSPRSLDGAFATAPITRTARTSEGGERVKTYWMVDDRLWFRVLKAYLMVVRGSSDGGEALKAHRTVVIGSKLIGR
jgi:hypothetical protein